MTLLRDNIWQFVGVIVALLIAGLSALWAWRRRELREITLMSRVSPVLHVGDDLQGEISVTFRGEPVRSLKLYEIAFVNTGNRPLLRSDFDQPVRVSFGNGASILRWRISASRPLELPVEISTKSVAPSPLASITVEPLLLNAGDGFAIECLVEGNALINTHCRIVGVQQIRESAFGANVPERTDKWLSYVPGLTVVVIGIAFQFLNPLISIGLGLVAGFSVGMWLFGWSDRSRFRRHTVLPRRNEYG